MMEEPKIRCDDYISPAEIAVPPDCVGLRLDMALARLLPEHSRSRLQAWLKDGLILLDGANADAKRKVWGGERLSIAVPPAP
ncbi:MAG: S4 domain-containing protein, partial [Rhodocyclaceae bacterium]|nr:S4 domain-containing protein [Rhodocyclaceae bacterium]